jgi:autophagy-related protein 9
MRDLNEVSHHFHRRKRVAAQYADQYLNQFPKDKMSQSFRFLTFIVSGLAAVLGIIILWDPDHFFGFEIAGRTSLFWATILSSLFMVFRNATADEDDDLWDPEISMKAVIANTHYCPDSWQGRLYSNEVRAEFADLYKIELVQFLEEIVTTITTPILLLYSLPRCADALVDFFREFTIDIDGLGTVCSFAVFDFKSGGKAAIRPGQQDDLREDYYGDKANKLVASYMSFLEHYGPNPRRGMHTRKRPFHPPPTFPGISGGGVHGFTEASGSTQRHGGLPVLRQSIQQTPRLAPSGSHISPMHSILLDPHHQPRTSPQHRPTRGTLRNGPASSRAHVLDDNPLEAEEDGDASSVRSPAMPRTTSNLMADDSELGDSWLKGGDAVDDDVGQEGEGSSEPYTGVLGMMMEYNLQTERRGGHI